MKKSISLLAGILLFFGTVLLLAGTVSFIDVSELQRNGVETSATITNIKKEVKYSNGEKKYDYDVTVEFTVDGQKYSGLLNDYNSSMFVGKEEGIYYNPSNPNEFCSDSSPYFYLIFSVVGLGLIVLGIKDIANTKKYNKRVKRLVQGGQKLLVPIVDVEIDESKTVNDRHPNIIVCAIEDYYTGNISYYRSEEIYANLNKNNLIGKSLPVYVDKKDSNNYLLDTSTII